MGGCGTQSFDPCISFAKTIINKLDSHKIDAHIGLILFSKKTKIVIDFNDDQNEAEVIRELSEIEYKENRDVSKLKIGKALEYAKDLFSNVRKESKKFAILVTGGRASDDVVIPSRNLKSSGVTIFSVGLGNEFEKSQLEIIASLPTNKFVYALEPTGVSTITDKIMDGFCTGKWL
jgi:hypothetical protein